MPWTINTPTATATGSTTRKPSPLYITVILTIITTIITTSSLTSGGGASDVCVQFLEHLGMFSSQSTSEGPGEGTDGTVLDEEGYLQ